ncbi:MAG: zf-HC2 domain-containing protein [Acidimicrobiales bacterium]
MGPMIEMGCEKWQEAIAMRQFGDLSANEEAALLAHLEGCDDCQGIAKEFAQTHHLLSFVDPAAVAPTAAVPANLTDKILRDLHHGGALQRRRRRATLTAAVGVGLIAASLIFAGLFSGSTVAKPNTQRTLALSGLTAVRASVVLSERPWGTSLTMHEQGLPGGNVYTVSMRTATGTWWVAGTYRSVAGQAVDATMSCAVPLDKITGLRVLNSAGTIVLSSYGDSLSTG